MKTTITLNGITQEIELTEEQAELFKEKKVTGWERSEYSCLYYDIAGYLDVKPHYDVNDAYDSKAFDCGNYFSTEAKAKQMADRISLMLRMQRWADINCPDGEWDGDNDHWIINYNECSNGFYIDFFIRMRQANEIYFGTKEGVLQAIEIFGEEIKRVMGV